jgi:hypothetical protein
MRGQPLAQLPGDQPAISGLVGTALAVGSLWVMRQEILDVGPKLRIAGTGLVQGRQALGLREIDETKEDLLHLLETFRSHG